MFAPSRGRSLTRAVETSVAAAAGRTPLSIPCLCTRTFSATATANSKLGRTPITIPPGVEILVGEPVVKEDPTTYLRIPRRTVTFEGPLGKLHLELPSFVKLTHDTEQRRVNMSVESAELKAQKQMWGTTWAHFNRCVQGVSEGHTALLRLVGVGYRATVELRPHKEQYPGQKFVILKLGFNHSVEMAVPQGIEASTPQQTRVLLTGIDRELLMAFAADIRRWRRPEPYKGKGIFVNDETIKLKQKKIK